MSLTDVRTPTLTDVVFKALDSRLSGVCGALPAVVQSYDASTQLAVIKPQLQVHVVQEDGTEVSESVPDVHNVPVMTLGGGGFFISFPLQAGDTGLAVFADRSMDIWKSTGGDVDPIDLRQRHLSDAIFIPGIRPRPAQISDASASNMVAGKSGGAQVVATSSQVQLVASQVKLGSASSSHAVAKGDSLNSALITVLSAIGTALGTITNGAPSGGAPAATAIATAVTAFTTAAATALSSVTTTS